jgi:hypothetical protein
MKPMPPGRAHLSPEERRTVARLHYLLSQPGLLHGSLRTRTTRCGKEGCVCTRGKPHSSFVLTVSDKGKQVSLHVPASWEERVRGWLSRDQEIRQLLLDLATVSTERLRNRKE